MSVTLNPTRTPPASNGDSMVLLATVRELLLSAGPASIPHSWLLAALLPSRAAPSPVKSTIIWAAPLIVVTAVVVVAASSPLVGGDVGEAALVTMHAALRRLHTQDTANLSHVS